MSKRMLDRINMGNMREKVQENVGQLFIWRREEFEASMALYTTPEIIQKLVDLYQEELGRQDKKIMKIKKERTRLLNAKESVLANRTEKFNPFSDELYAVYNYASVVRVKNNVGTLFEKETGKSKNLVTGNIAKGQKREDAVGTQVGHGEFGHAVSTTKALASESVMKTKASQRHSGSESFRNLETALINYKTRLGINLDLKHYQQVSPRGKLTKEYTAILSSQDARLNLEEGGIEKAALGELRKAVEAEYATLLKQKGSKTLYEATEQHLNSTLASSRNTKYNGKKSSKPVSNKSKSKAAPQKKSKEINNSVKVVSGAGAISPKKRKTANKSRASDQLAMIAKMNTQLPKTVAANMTDPRLNYRSGRFSNSVKITDITQTPQGFPSIGYTYDKFPYQTFEKGFAQGSVERDPRRLIDASIRELAIQFAIGRFYTRRE